MRTLLVFTALILSACAPASKNDAVTATPAPSLTPAPATVVCAVYDSCTYTGGLFSQPVYNCTSKTLQAVDHPEIPASYFQSNSCLTYREDFHTQQSWCGPMNQFPCTISVQGPGPEAIPALGL